MTESNYSKLKIENLDLEEVIKTYPLSKNSLSEAVYESYPRHLKFDVQKLYRKTGLP